MARLTGVFRDVGYTGASLSLLADATGLKRPSLYHRFPRGKEQMAQEVLAAANDLMVNDVLSVLKEDGSPRDRLDRMAKRLSGFYDHGRKACLLNLLSSAQAEQSPFAGPIKNALQAMIDALSVVICEAGFAPTEAKGRAERGVMLLQGSLVLSRGLGSSKPFRAFLRTFSTDLIGDP